MTLVILGGLMVGAVPASHAAGPLTPEAVPKQIPEDPFAGLTERFRAMAQRDEKANEWRRALARWEAVVAMEPTDGQARERITAIQRTLKANAERHFKEAKAALQAKQYSKAFRSFLRTLSYDASNAMALTMVKSELNAKSLNEYTVKRGDTLREIAVAEYEDPELTYLVQYYNGIKNPRDLKVGQVLKLPVIAGVRLTQPPATAVAAVQKPATQPAAKQEAAPAPARKEPAKVAAKAPAAAPAAAQPVEETPLAAGAAIVAAEVRQEAPAPVVPQVDPTKAKVDEAQALIKARKYEQAAAVAESILETDPANGEARGLISESYYEQGKQLQAKEQYLAAMQVLTRVDPKYKDTAALLEQLQGQMKGDDAEAHYIAGVTAFLGEDLDTAIKEWNRTLELDPNHPQAPKDLENARALQAKLAQVR